MAFFESLYEKNFIEYASYVIKERAIPYVDDGLKPVQRRILHSLLEMDDGKFHKVASVVGQSMKFHPHGDASIYSALVVLANKEMFIEKQGNFGNIYTGDGASAARYIECRITPMARDILYNPELTRYVDSYDGRNKEPVTFPAKIPVLLAQGTEGIAVGMATKILPHNVIELIEAQIAYLKNEDFQVYPDFLTKGYIDVSGYEDGNGKVLVRAKLDTKDPKKIVIRELPFGITTENIIASIESAAKKGKIKISSIDDYTAEDVEVEIKLARGANAESTVDALYAFSDCELSISANLMVVKDQRPEVMTVTGVIKYNTDRLIEILRQELVLENEQLQGRLHSKTLEQIFIGNRIYKVIETMDSPKKIINAVSDALHLYKKEINGEVSTEDVETLLKIPIRRISLYDINKAKKEMRDIRRRMKEIRTFLGNIVIYSITFLQGLIEKYRPHYPRMTSITSFQKVDVREAAHRDISLSYDKQTGYLGMKIEGDNLFQVSPYDRILVIRKNGEYSVIDVPDKLFVDKGMRFCGFIEKGRVYTVLYKEKKNGYVFIKRCHIEKFILNKVYTFFSGDFTFVDMTTNSEMSVVVNYTPRPRMRTLEEHFRVAHYAVRGARAGGIRLTKKETKRLKFIHEIPREVSTASE